MSLDSITLIIYASKSFQAAGQTLARRAAELGFEDIRVLTPQELSQDFVNENRDTLSRRRGAGYWLWKPWILQFIANSLPENHNVFYVDAGVILNKDISYFATLLSDKRIHLWTSGDEFNKNKYWIDGGVWDSLVGSKSNLENPHYWAGAILSKNTPNFRAVISDWLQYSKNPLFLRPDSFSDYEPQGDVIAHRHDQSILNCLVQRNPEWFCLHAETKKGFGKIFLVHRRGNLKRVKHAKFIYYLGIILRKSSRYLPKQLRLSFFATLTRIRKPDATNAEISRHREFFLRY
jgi:hypothetical protein